MCILTPSRLRALGWATLLVTARLGAAADSPTAVPTLEELLQPLSVNHARLAPDGAHLAAITTAPDGARSLIVIDLATRKTEAIKSPADLDIGAVEWTDRSHLVFTSGEDDRYAFAMFHGELGRLAHATRFSADELTRIVGLPRSRPNRLLAWVVAGAMSDDGHNLLVEADVNVSAILRDGRRSKSTVARTYDPPKGGIPVAWHPLQNGELGYCVLYAGRKFSLHRFEASANAWREVNLDLDRYHVVQADPDLQRLWVSHYEDGTGFTLERFDPRSEQFEPPIWRDPTYDLATARLHFSRKSGHLVAISYEQRRHFTKVLEEPLLSTSQQVQARFPDRIVRLLNYDDDERRFLFRVSAPQDAGRLVLVDLAVKSMEVISEIAPVLADKKLQGAFPISYRTADGLKEEGYITLPAGAGPAHKVPLVVLVHDGPWRRDVWDFDAEAQWFAARGYAVLQPNYRGSPGYAPAISFNERFAFTKMHADVIAATRAGLALEMVDAQRVAICGHGFGGFLALMSAGAEPDLFRAAISIGGTFDWEGFIRELGYYPALRGDYEVLRDFVGQPGRDRDAFEALSPLRRPEAIKAGVFLAYTENPNVVSHAQSGELAGKLRNLGRTCETFEFKTSWYDLRGQASWLELMRRVDAFLAARL